MWHVIVPVKAWGAAKSRLSLPLRHRQTLARAMAQDTVERLAQCSLVCEVSVVTTSPFMVGSAELRAATRVLVQPDGVVGLDEALSWAIGETSEKASRRATGTAVVVADLPALTSPALEQLLNVASGNSVSMVVDRHGTGTTVLAATEPQLLTPRFGAYSATRHRRSDLNRDMTVLGRDVCGPGVRCDVDTLDDLAAARSLGLGPHSRLVDAQLGSPS